MVVCSPPKRVVRRRPPHPGSAPPHAHSLRSQVTFVDGDKGMLQYRGYPIEQLAKNSDMLDCIFLLMVRCWRPSSRVSAARLVFYS